MDHRHQTASNDLETGSFRRMKPRTMERGKSGGGKQQLVIQRSRSRTKSCTALRWNKLE